VLPKAVEAAVIERHTCAGYRVATCELNGWRNDMEDAHLIYMQKDWAFFGVFDGHGGHECSKWVADRLNVLLREKGCPKDDQTVKSLMLQVDAEFLATSKGSGSTGTMCIVHPPTSGNGQYTLRVANVGDSRVLLGRRDGSMVNGGGTDGGLTTDHKPDHPSEKERIYRTGGTVVEGMGGVPRVNGDLAVSRAFGDAEYKRTGGPRQEDHPVSAEPEMGTFTCEKADFVLLVCDGVSEGDFPNAQVIQLAAQVLADTDDPAEVSRAVCHRAIETNSKDNITCMMVVFDGQGEEQKTLEFIPGPLAAESAPFYKAYTAMAARGNCTLAQAVEKRYSILKQQNSAGFAEQEELKLIGSPPAEGAARAKYFEDWAEMQLSGGSSVSGGRYGGFGPG